MGCPHARDMIGDAVARCPFLQNVASSMGEAFARQVALRPSQPVRPPALAAGASARRPLLEEDYSDFESAVNLFHGPSGVVPLKKFGAGGGCPISGHGASQHAASVGPATRPMPPSSLPAAHGVQPRRPARTTLPLGAISLSGGFGPLPRPDGLARFLKQRARGKRPQRKPSGDSSGGGGDRVQNTRQPQPEKLSQSSSSGGGGGRCPMRKFIEPLGGLLPLGSAALSRLQHMKCPAAVVAARAAVARTSAVRSLRPQALPVKMLAISAFAALLNVPAGAWREHTEKFSPGWFVAVHMPIPFIAILRKAVIMPKWAMAATIAAAVLGQAVGARLERRRLTEAAAAPVQCAMDSDATRRLSLIAAGARAASQWCPALARHGGLDAAVAGGRLNMGASYLHGAQSGTGSLPPPVAAA